MDAGQVVAAYTVIQPRDLRNVVMADIQAAAIAHQSCDVCQAGCTARRRIGFSCGHSVCDDCISRLAKNGRVTCSQCRRVSTYSPTNDSSHNAMLSLVKVRMKCDVETTLGDSESHAKRCLPCMSSIAASLLQDSASSLATLRAKEHKIKRLSQDNRRLQLRTHHLEESEVLLRQMKEESQALLAEMKEDLRETRTVVVNLRRKVEALYDKEDSLLAKLQDGYRREEYLNDQHVASKKRVALLLAKVRAERKKAGQSEERAKRAIDMLEEKVKEEEEEEGSAKKNADTERAGQASVSPGVAGAIAGAGEGGGGGSGGSGGGGGSGSSQRANKEGKKNADTERAAQATLPDVHFSSRRFRGAIAWGGEGGGSGGGGGSGWSQRAKKKTKIVDEESRAKKKVKTNAAPERAGQAQPDVESVSPGVGGAIAGGGEGGGSGGGGGSRSSQCERCTKRGFPCNHIVLRANVPSCEECRSKRMGCSFSRP